MINAIAIESLSQEEHKRIRGTVNTFKILFIVMFVALIVCEAIGFNVEKSYSNKNYYLYLVPLIGITFAYLFVARHYMFFPADLKANHKIVADTTVLRKKKWGWFDMDARGGLSNVMMGSAYYLYIPDDSKRSGRRRFRILMDAYDALQVGQKIRVAWLPKSGQILSIDTDDGFHWVAWDRRPGDHG